MNQAPRPTSTRAAWLSYRQIIVIAVAMSLVTNLVLYIGHAWWSNRSASAQFELTTSQVATGRTNRGDYIISASFTTDARGRPDVLTLIAPKQMPPIELAVTDDTLASEPMTRATQLTAGTHVYKLSGGRVRSTDSGSGPRYKTTVVVLLGPQGSWLVLEPRAELLPLN